LTGIPPLAGFVGKFYVFAAAIKQAGSQPGLSWLYWLVGIGLLTSVFSLYYYANVIKVMYFGKRAEPVTMAFNSPAILVIALGLVGVVLFGLFPASIMDFVSTISTSTGFVAP
jgi:NADH-quinone oxidoreductase subunit N